MKCTYYNYTFYAIDSVPGLPTNFLLEYSGFQRYDVIIKTLHHYCLYSRPPVYPPYACAGPGSITVLNTIESFKTCDKKKILEDAGRQVYNTH